MSSTMNAQDFLYVERQLQNVLENGATPGVALLVEKKGELLYQRALGYAQLYPVTRELCEDTIFDIASLTKVVTTTTAIMLLLRDKTITLDDPIKKFLPEFSQSGKDQIMFRHLLTHSAGLPDYLPLYEYVQQEANRQGNEEFVGSPEAKRYLLESVYQTNLIYAPGEEYHYSDLGFILLGDLIEKISGTTLERYCEEMIFRPLEMGATFFQKHGEPLRERDFAATERCEWRGKILCGEVHDENAYAMGGVAGHAGVFSTLDDIRKFMNMLQQCYAGTDDFISKSIVQKFFSRQHFPEDSTRALGWDTPSDKGSTGGELLSKTSVGHTGFTGTSIWLDLERELLILLFSNRVHPSRTNQKFLKIRPRIHDTVVIATDNLKE